MCIFTEKFGTLDHHPPKLHVKVLKKTCVYVFPNIIVDFQLQSEQQHHHQSFQISRSEDEQQQQDTAAEPLDGREPEKFETGEKNHRQSEKGKETGEKVIVTVKQVVTR